jgi:hypothetical protein
MSETISLTERACMACRAAVPDVLEMMFFELVAESTEVCSLPAAEPFDTSRVDFGGSARGYLIVAAPPSLSACLAAAFLALEDQGVPAFNIEFVLGELANILCGSTLGRFQPDGIFRLSTPVTQLGRTLAEPGGTGFSWIRFPMDNGPLFVGLRLESSQ